MRKLLIVVTLLLASAASAQSWQYGTLVIGSTQVSWFAPGEDYSAPDMRGLATHLITASESQPATNGALAAALNALGREGWELVTISSTGVYVFRRPSG